MYSIRVLSLINGFSSCFRFKIANTRIKKILIIKISQIVYNEKNSINPKKHLIIKILH